LATFAVNGFVCFFNSLDAALAAGGYLTGMLHKQKRSITHNPSLASIYPALVKKNLTGLIFFRNFLV
jgi:hypothetical protein